MACVRWLIVLIVLLLVRAPTYTRASIAPDCRSCRLFSFTTQAHLSNYKKFTCNLEQISMHQANGSRIRRLEHLSSLISSSKAPGRRRSAMMRLWGGLTRASVTVLLILIGLSFHRETRPSVPPSPTPAHAHRTALEHQDLLDLR